MPASMYNPPLIPSSQRRIELCDGWAGCVMRDGFVHLPRKLSKDDLSACGFLIELANRDDAVDLRTEVI